MAYAWIKEALRLCDTMMNKINTINIAFNFKLNFLRDFPNAA